MEGWIELGDSGSDEAAERAEQAPQRERPKVGKGVRIASVRTGQYHKLLKRLPAAIQKIEADQFKNYFLKDPKHPLLEGKMVPDRKRRLQVWRVSITHSYRALAVIEETVDAASGERLRTYVWYWCGSHEDYNNIVG